MAPTSPVSGRIEQMQAGDPLYCRVRLLSPHVPEAV